MFERDAESVVDSRLWALVHEDSELCELFVDAEAARCELERLCVIAPPLAAKLSVRRVSPGLEICPN